MPSKSYDVLIIGSGHAGGMAAYALARKGISCLMLNAGPAADLQHDRSPIPAYQLPYRGLTQPGLMTDNSFSPYVQNAFVHQEEVPYTYDADKPYPWARSRLVGGRSIFWGGQSFRLSDLEFKSRDFDGYGDNWPISLATSPPITIESSNCIVLLDVRTDYPNIPTLNLQLLLISRTHR